MKKLNLLSVLMALTLILCVPSIRAYAADEPADALEKYTFDGVDYVNVGNKTFASDTGDYYHSMLNNPLNDGAFSNYSINDLWTRFAYLAVEHTNRTDRPGHNIFSALQHSIGDQSTFHVLWSTPYNPNGIVSTTGAMLDDPGWGLDGSDRFGLYRQPLKSAADANAMETQVVKDAIEIFYKNEDLENDYYMYNLVVDVKEPTELKGPIYYTSLGIVGKDLEDYNKHYQYKDYDFHTVVVAFNNFSITPITPDEDASGENTYVETVLDNNLVTDNLVISDVKNLSSSSVTASQNITESSSSTVTSSINGSESHTHSFSVKMGAKITLIKDFFEFSPEASETWSDTVSKGWSKSEGTTTSTSKTNSVSVTLPPYTTILIDQDTSTSKVRYTYNCPVSLNFDVHIFYAYGAWEKKTEHDNNAYTRVYFDPYAVFGGSSNAREDLQERYLNGTSSSAMADKDGVDWAEIKSSGWTKSIRRAAYVAPFDVTSGSITKDAKVVKSEVKNVLPVYPIDSIKPVNPNSVLTNQSWLYEQNMIVGDYNYTSHIGLKALNKYGAEFATFYPKYGHYIVVDEDGNEDTSGRVVKLVKDGSSGQTKYIATGEGVAYLKYIIDEDVYQTAAMAVSNTPDSYITNADINKNGKINTAVIQINVGTGHQHTWLKTRYVWSDDYSTCTATRVCQDDNTHIQGETVDAAVKIESEATCTDPGKIVYTAIFENSDFETQTKTVEIPAIGHEWSDWVKVDDEKHQRVCAHDSSHTETADHVWDKGVKKNDASTKGQEYITYTCKDCGAQYTEKNTSISWLKPVYTWSEDNKTCHAKRVGKYDSSYVEEEISDAACEVKRTATCTKDGITVYTAVFENDGFETQTKTITDEATGHEWGEWTVVREATTKKKGLEQRVCLHNSKHVQKRSIAKVAVKTSPFIRTYCKKRSKSTITLAWTKVKGATSYAVYGGRCGDALRKLETLSNANSFVKIRKIRGKKLKQNVYYKFYVVAYGKDSSGNTTELCRTQYIHLLTKGSTEYGNIRKIILKTKKSVKLSKGSAAKIKAVQKKDKNIEVQIHQGVTYVSTNPNVAKVGAYTGTVKAVETGKCVIYCFAQNGLYKTVNVTVK